MGFLRINDKNNSRYFKDNGEWGIDKSKRKPFYGSKHSLIMYTDAMKNFESQREILNN